MGEGRACIKNTKVGWSGRIARDQRQCENSIGLSIGALTKQIILKRLPPRLIIMKQRVSSGTPLPKASQMLKAWRGADHLHSDRVPLLWAMGI